MPAAATAAAAATATVTAADAASAYCVKCKAKGEMKDPKGSVASNGRAMMQGTCAKCGTKMTKFVAAAKK